MSGTLAKPAGTPSLASRKEEVEPPLDAGGSELSEITSSVQDSLSCPPSSVEEANSGESKSWVRNNFITALSGSGAFQIQNSCHSPTG